MKREEDEENLFKKNNKPEENEMKKLQLQTGKKMAFSGRPSQKVYFCVNSMFLFGH
jgi:hypothetical protein